MGDKVYWKCRRHSELGCRGRAITRGFRVTVMRDHCHPHDKEGLKMRRRKEKVPCSSLPEGPEAQEEGVSLWLYPVEPEPTPQQSIEEPEEDQGYRSLALQSLPPKKRPAPGVGESMSSPHLEQERTLSSFMPKYKCGVSRGFSKCAHSQKYKCIPVIMMPMGQTAL